MVGTSDSRLTRRISVNFFGVFSPKHPRHRYPLAGFECRSVGIFNLLHIYYQGVELEQSYFYFKDL
jgi:hypothetical protein